MSEGKDRARLFRIFCLLNRYGNNTEYSSDRIKEAANIDKKISEFFQSTEAVLRELNKKVVPHKWTAKENELFQR